MAEERDIFLTIRERFESEEEYKEYIANIFLKNAYALFGQMLGFLCEKSLLSRREIGRRSTEYRDDLEKKGRLPTKRSTGSVDHTGISKVIGAKKDPSYGQVFIWFRILKERFADQGYKVTCQMINEPVFKLTQEFETDMWHLALFGTPREVVTAYEKHDGIIY